MSSLSDSFEKRFTDDQSPDPSQRPEELDEAVDLPPRWLKIWLLEDALGVKTSVWGKSRAKLNNEDLEDLLNGVFENLNIRPALVEVKNDDNNFV